MYLLDANAFMEASRLYYAFDIAPGFWAWLGDGNLTGRIGSIRAVRDEITAGADGVVAWAGNLPSTFWVDDTDDVVAAMANLANWASDPARLYKPEAIGEFLGAADLSLIAHAMARDATVVTRERPAPDSKKKVKIPDVCSAFGVAWVDPFSVYKALGLRLVR
jgi:hypothetical protein